MANKLTTNPIIVDTFTDTIISKNPITVKKIVLHSAAAGDILQLFHGTSNTGIDAVRLRQNANLMVEIDFGIKGLCFPNGLFLSAVDCAGLDSGTDKVLIYLK